MEAIEVADAGTPIIQRSPDVARHPVTGQGGLETQRSPARLLMPIAIAVPFLCANAFAIRSKIKSM